MKTNLLSQLILLLLPTFALAAVRPTVTSLAGTKEHFKLEKRDLCAENSCKVEFVILQPNGKTLRSFVVSDEQGGQKISAGQCRETLGTLKKELNRLHFSAVTIDPKACEAHKRDKAVQGTA